MKKTRIAGIVLVVLGAIALIYQGVTYKSKEKILDIGPIQATKETKKTIPLSPVLGGCILVVGVGLLFIPDGPRKS